MAKKKTNSKLDQAILFATKHHSGQTRDGDNPLPYIIHPVEVIVNLRHVGHVTDEASLIAAALHDVIEKSGADPDEIEQRFGKRVRHLVEELTRHEPSKAETKGLIDEEIWQLRSTILLEEIAKMSSDAQRIKLADRLSNLNEAVRTKMGDKLDRYLGQTYLILEIVPREVNPGLWDAIRDLLGQVVKGEPNLES